MTKRKAFKEYVNLAVLTENRRWERNLPGRENFLEAAVNVETQN